jgi:hypothetical protein
MPAYTIKPLVTAIAVNTGGRNGHSETTDHSVSVNLSVRKEMGGPGLPDTTTPEHLFAAGYAACFGGAIEFTARQHKQGCKRNCCHMPHLRRAARRRGLWHCGQDAGQDSDAAEGRSGRSGRRDPRKGMSLQPRDTPKY